MWEQSRQSKTSDEDIHIEMRGGPIVRLLGLYLAVNFTLWGVVSW